MNSRCDEKLKQKNWSTREIQNQSESSWKHTSRSPITIIYYYIIIIIIVVVVIVIIITQNIRQWMQRIMTDNCQQSSSKLMLALICINVLNEIKSYNTIQMKYDKLASRLDTCSTNSSLAISRRRHKMSISVRRPNNVSQSCTVNLLAQHTVSADCMY